MVSELVTSDSFRSELERLGVRLKHNKIHRDTQRHTDKKSKLTIAPTGFEVFID